MRSSGAYVNESESHVDFDCECGFEGCVDVKDDHETEESWWVCPDCRATHQIDWDWNEDPDRWRD